MQYIYHSFIAIISGYALLSTVYAIYLNRKVKRAVDASNNSKQLLHTCSDALLERHTQLEKSKREVINLTEKVSHLLGHLDQCRQDSNKTIKMVKDMEKAEDKLHQESKTDQVKQPKKRKDNKSE